MKSIQVKSPISLIIHICYKVFGFEKQVTDKFDLFCFGRLLSARLLPLFQGRLDCRWHLCYNMTSKLQIVVLKFLLLFLPIIMRHWAEWLYSLYSELPLLIKLCSQARATTGHCGLNILGGKSESEPPLLIKL